MTVGIGGISAPSDAPVVVVSQPTQASASRYSLGGQPCAVWERIFNFVDPEKSKPIVHVLISDSTYRGLGLT